MNKTQDKVFTTTEEIICAAKDDFFTTEYNEIAKASRAVSKAMSALYSLDETFGDTVFSNIANTLEFDYVNALFETVVCGILEEKENS